MAAFTFGGHAHATCNHGRPPGPRVCHAILVIRGLAHRFKDSAAQHIQKVACMPEGQAKGSCLLLVAHAMPPAAMGSHQLVIMCATLCTKGQARRNASISFVLPRIRTVQECQDCQHA